MVLSQKGVHHRSFPWVDGEMVGCPWADGEMVGCPCADGGMSLDGR